MNEGKRLSWIEDGLNQSDRIQKNDLQERINRENDATLKERKRVQDDEQKRINRYSEGMCYGCGKIDKVLSTLIYACIECIEDKGEEALLTIVAQKRNIWDLCDFHNKWVFNDIYQINVSLCTTCLRRVILVHKAYRKAGGHKNSPDEVRRRQIYGKDYKKILGTGIKSFKLKRS